MQTTITTIYLFMAIVQPAAAGRVGYVELYRTTDKAACEAHVTDWTAKLAPQKFACVTLNTDKMKVRGDEE